jgi:hypothetical protein
MTLTSVTAMPRALRVVALRVVVHPVARLVGLRVAAHPVARLVARLVALLVPAHPVALLVGVLPVTHLKPATRFHWRTISHPYLTLPHGKDSNMYVSSARLYPI